MSEYRVHQPGDLLRLYEDVAGCPAGDYVLMSVGDTVCVSRVGENPCEFYPVVLSYCEQ